MLTMLTLWSYIQLLPILSNDHVKSAIHVGEQNIAQQEIRYKANVLANNSEGLAFYNPWYLSTSVGFGYSCSVIAG